MNIPLNQELARIVSQFSNISNANLLFTKYVSGWRHNWEFESKEKGRFLENAVKVNYDKKTFEKFLNRWQLLLKETNATQIRGKVLWRLVVGLGSGSVLETSMTLHHILGVPYIPGSALKGVVSSYYVEKNSDSLEVEKQHKEQEGKKYKTLKEFARNEVEEYINLFGTHTQKGKVTFLDAYPSSFPELELDIMNPHYPEYYSEGKPPADWMSPNPIKFLTVKKDTEFIFAFKTDEDDLKEQVTILLKGALQDLGVGAKTAVGYGYFRI